jgi:biopolymer transport protein ExbB
MKLHLCIWLLTGAVLAGSAFGQDAAVEQGEKSRPAVVQPIDRAQDQAEADAAQAEKEAADRKFDMLYEQGLLSDRIAAMETRKKELDRSLASLNTSYHANDKEIERLQKRLEDQQGAMDEVSGSVRGIAQDTATVIRQSLVSGDQSGRDAVFEPLLGETEFPTLDNIQLMTDVIFDEIRRNGTIVAAEQGYVDAAGRQTRGEVIRIGAFNALYRRDGKVGYLEYIPSKQALHELSVTPPQEMISAAAAFAAGKAPDLYVDISAGGAFRQLTDMPTWYEQLQAGGALMYPLIAVGLIALLIIIERLMVLVREGRESESLARKITPLLDAKKYNDALIVCTGKKTCLADVVEAGIGHRHEPVEVLESVLEEAIQKTLPRLDRYMGSLQIMGMVSPLLGLLGTVTGMIATFQMITLYGTGDPKIMSGGISEALVTTQYGLMIAIPIILVHGYLQGRIDRIVNTLEEKSIMLVNAVKKSSGASAAV